jgi:UDP-N-acetylmuramyl pentapeptide phosphotransferase/UDP-N-acetylglucosamine-1-phosphate transferase
LSLASGVVFVALGYRRFREWGILARNVEGQAIVTALGAPIVLSALAVAVVGWAFGFRPDAPWLTVTHSILLVVMGLGGLLDDLFPDSRKVRGFVGHFGALFARGRLTRGATKAVLGGAVSLWAGVQIAHGDIWEGLANGLIIGLVANSVNLLDVRPGRALKWWAVLVFLPLLRSNCLPLIMPLVVAVVLYSPLDLRKRAMLGDVGALAIGASVGFAWCVVLAEAPFGGVVRVAAAIGLIALNVYAELGSLSKVIRRSPVLEYIDSLWVGPLRARNEE